MKLYFRPGSLSLAAHIILLEGGVSFESVALDLFGKRTLSGVDFRTISPFGAIPTLVITDGTVLTQPSAILQHCADLTGIAAFAPAIGSEQLKSEDLI